MRNTVTLTLSVLVALAFFGAGLAKLTSQAMMVQEFNSFGLPIWFMFVTGALEIASAILILIPRLAYIGAALLVCTMACALFEHLTHGQGALTLAPFILLVLTATVGTLRGWGRRARLAVGI